MFSDLACCEKSHTGSDQSLLNYHSLQALKINEIYMQVELELPSHD